MPALPRFTTLPPAPDRTLQQGEAFAIVADLFFDAFPDLVLQFNNSILPALETLSQSAANDAAAVASATFNPANYYLKTAIDTMIAAATSGFAAASGAHIFAGNSSTVAVTPAALFAAAAPVAVSYASTVTLDFSAGLNFTVGPLTGGCTLANPTNQKVGQSGVILVTQDASGSRTLAYGSNWKFPSGAPPVSTAANAIDLISYYVQSSGVILATLVKAFA
jgi:hypothetical protein